MTRLVWVDRKGRAEPLNLEPGPYQYPRLCGNRVALNIQGANRDIWVLDLDRVITEGGAVSLVRISEGPTEDILPLWNRDCSRVYYASNRSGDFQIYSRSADGSGTEVLLSSSPEVRLPLSVSPDNRLIVGTNTDSPDIGLLTLSEPNNPQWLPRDLPPLTNPSVSPNGEWLLYQSQESTVQDEIYLRPFKSPASRRKVVSIGGGRHARWGRGGNEIFYRNLRGDMMEVPVQWSPELRIEAPQTLFENDGFRMGGSWSDDLAPDGRFLMVQDSGASVKDVTIWVTVNATALLNGRLAQR